MGESERVLSGAPDATAQNPWCSALFGGKADPRVWLAMAMAATALLYIRSLGDEFIVDHRGTIIGNPYLNSWSYLWKSMVNDEWWFINPSHTPVGSYYRPIPNIWVWISH